MKKRLAILFLMVSSVVCLVFGVAACKNETAEHPETGLYYYDTDDGDTYYATLQDGTFLLQIADSVSKGTYSLKDDGAMELSLSDDSTALVSLTYLNTALSVVYDGSSMQFMRSVSYTVSYDACGGSSVNPVKALNGKSVKKPTDPVKTGHAFLGWYSDEAYTKAFAFGVTPVTADTTLYAKWSDSLSGEAEYTVWFELGYEGATNPAAQTTVAGKLYGVETPVREGYQFGGWWISDYESADRLTYRYSEDYQFTSSTTVYAQWIPTASEGKLNAPLPRVEGNMIAWDAVSGASGYYVEVSDPNGAKLVDRNVGSTSVEVKFDSSVAGLHVIKVTAVSSNAANNSPATVRYFNNKALGKVSLFTVVEPSVLTYNAVEHAQKYKISIVCGNDAHNHKDIDNGTSTYFNFEGCEMQEGGIAFTVTAIASGYSSSTSRTFYYDRRLDKIEEFYFDGATEKVSWQPVLNASDYAVTVTEGNNTYKLMTGGKNYVSLKNYSSQNVTIGVQPVTKGYNSPAASEYTFKREGLAAPTGVKVRGNELVWNEVSGAEQYVVNVSGADYTTKGKETTYPLNELSLTNGVDYTITVRAIKAGGAQQSVPGEPITAQYYSLSPAVTYSQNQVSWNAVIGAKSYEVKVNGGVTQTVDADTTTAAVTLTQSGENTISVRYIDENKSASDWVSVTVYAYKITLDEREGSEVEDIYCALGDALTLPVSERSGYDLNGWYTAPGGASSNSGRYFNGDKLAVASDIELYAGWSAKKFSVEYVMDDYATVTNPVSFVTFRSNYTLEMPVMNEEYSYIVFLGWFSEPDGRGIQYADPNGKSLDTWKYLKNIKVYPAWFEYFEFVLQTEGTYKDTYAVKRPSSLSYSNPFTKLVVPETYKGKPVTIVEGGTFRRLRYTTQVEIPDTIRLIYTETAFEYSEILEEVNIYKTGHTSDPVYSSHEGVLYYNDEMANGKTLAYVPLAKTGHYVVAPDTKCIGIKTFSSCNLTSVTIPSSVVNIEYRAFYDSKIENVYFDRETGDELKIGKEAFANCASLVSITLPSRVKNIDPVSLFDGASSLENIFVYDDNESYSHSNGMLCNKAGNTILYCPPAKRGELRIAAGVRTIGDGAFKNCTGFYSLTLPAFVTSVGKNAFEGCTRLRSVTFDGANGSFGELTVKEGAFKGCSSLNKIEFKENSKVVAIGYGAFEGCEKISSITLPDTLREVSSGLFAGCTGLVDVNVSPDHPYLSSEDGVVYDKNKTEIKYYSINRKDETFVLNNSIRTIGANVFEGNLSLKKIVIGGGVELIDQYAFRSCSNLETVVFVKGGNTNGLTFGDYAFNGCMKLKNFYVAESATADPSEYVEQLPGWLKSIGKYAFNMASLGSLVLGEGITEIGDYAFANTNITSVVLPASLMKLGTCAFYGCARLEEVSTAENSKLETIGERAFSGTALTSFNVPKSVTSIEDGAFSIEEFSQITFESRAQGDKPLSLGEAVFSGTRIARLELPYGTKITAGLQPSYGYFSCTLSDMESLEEVVGLDNDECVVQNGVLFLKDGKGNPVTAAMALPAYRGDVVIPNTVQEVYERAFYGTMPASIVFEKNGTADLTIGSQAFGGIGRVYDQSEWEWGESLYEDCPIELPKRLKKLEEQAFYYSGFTALTFEDGETRMTEIPDQAFFGVDSIASLTLPRGIKRIGERAFAPDWFGGEGGLIELVLNDDLEMIDTEAFGTHPGLKSITIPASVEVIGDEAFSGCSGVETLTFAEGTRLAIISDRAFAGLELIESVTLPASYCGSSGSKGDNGKYSGNGVMAEYLFSGCEALKEITFTDGCPLITSVGDGVFGGCVSLETLTLPVNVKEIGERLFAVYDDEKEFALKELTVPSGVSAQSIVNLSELISVVKFAGGGVSKEVQIEENGIVYGKDAAGNLVSLLKYPASVKDKTYVVPSTVKTFGDSIFSGNVYLESVVLPEGILEIGEYMFSEATALKSITIPASVTSIGDSAFSDCTSLERIDFATTASGSTALTTIGSMAFAGCSALVSLEIPDSVMVLGESIVGSWYYPDDMDNASAQFAGCTSLKSVKLPKNLVVLYGVMFKGCKALETVIVPERSALNEIEVYAFKDCTSLKSIDFSNANNLEKVGDFTFDGCTSLASATFSESGQLTLGDNVFSGTALTSIKLPRQLRAIGNDCFNGVSTLSAVMIDPDCRLKTIGDGAFEDTALTSFAFSNTPALTKVGAYAFYGTEISGVVNLPDGVSVIGEYAFADCTGITQINIPAAINTIGASAFENTAISSVTIGGSDTAIGAKAFSGCAGLTEVHLESGVSSIGNMAFAYAPVTTVVIPATVHTIDGNPFVGCALEDMTILSADVDLLFEEGWLFNKDRTVIYSASPATSGAYKVPANVTTLMPGAFAGTKITSIELSASITKIFDNTFKGCTELTAITIGQNVTEIGESAFEGCTKLQTLVFEAGGSEAIFIGKAAFKGCTALQSVTLPHRLRNRTERKTVQTSWGLSTEEYMYTGLGESAFEGCTALQTVGAETVAADFNTKGYGNYCLGIGVKAFKGCTALTSITFGDGLGEGNASNKNGNMISASAFEGCTKLASVNFPDKFALTGWNMGAGTIGSYAFKDCASLKTIEIPECVYILSEYSFAGSGLEEITLPKKSAGSAMFDYTYMIHDYAFKGCTSLRRFVCLGDFYRGGGSMSSGGLTFSGETGVGLFEGCTALEYVEFGGVEGTSYVSRIGDRSFAGCENLKTVIINFYGMYDEIGEECFKDCTSLTTVTLSGYASLSIEKNAFAGCTALTALDLTKSKQDAKNNNVSIRLYEGAFKDCTSLADISIANYTSLSFGKNSFAGCTALASLDLTKGKKNATIRIDKATFEGMTGLTVTVPFADAAAAVKALGEGWNGDATVVYNAPASDADNG